jgi:hypothetical protein
MNVKKASEIRYKGNGFPYVCNEEDKHITYMLVEKRSGHVTYYALEYTLKFKQEIFFAIHNVKKGEAVLYAIWSGRHVSKVYLIDNLIALTNAINEVIDGEVSIESYIAEKVKEEARYEIERQEKQNERNRAYDNFLKTYQAEEGKYFSAKEIFDLVKPYVTYTTDDFIRRIMKERNVPWQYESRNSRRLKCFLLTDAIKGLKAEFYKWHNLNSLYNSD